MAFVPIDISSIDESALREVSDRFASARIKAKKLAKDEWDFRKKSTHIASNAIQALGGDADLAMEMVAAWVYAPYLSRLRWAVTAASGQSVVDELSKVQDRSWRYFVHARAQYGYDMSLLTTRPSNYATWLQYKKIAKAQSLSLVDKIEEFRIEMSTMRDFADQSSTRKTVHTARVMSALSQSLVKKNSIYRGICCEQGYEIHQALKKNDSVEIASDHAVSFTSNKSTAIGFAENALNRMEFDHNQSIVVEIKTPTNALIATPDLFWKLENEEEYVVATNGRYKIHKKNVEIVMR